MDEKYHPSEILKEIFLCKSFDRLLSDTGSK